MPLPQKNQALAALYRNCVFHSDARVDAHDHVARALADHVLRWKSGAPDAAMFKGELNHLRMYVLRYGAEVDVAPHPFDDFALIHTSLSGGVEIETDGLRFNVPEGRTAVLAPKKRARLRWCPGTEQLILRVPYALIREATGCAANDDIALAPGFLVPRAHGAQWDLIAQSLLNILSMPSESTVHQAWLDHFERNVALFLLSHQPAISPASPGLIAEAPPPEPAADALRAGDSKRFNALLAYIDSRLCAPISLDDLARIAGVSVRTLNAMCHHHHGATPMELLRNMRLDAVRRRLQLQPDASVTDTALAFGFGHLGRFAHYYQERFHELPRATQARQRGEIAHSGRPGP